MVSPTRIERVERAVDELELVRGGPRAGDPLPQFEGGLALWFPVSYDAHDCPGAPRAPREISGGQGLVKVSVLGWRFGWRDLRSRERSPSRPRSLDQGTLPVVRELIDRYAPYPILELWLAVGELATCQECGQSHTDPCRDRDWWGELEAGKVPGYQLSAAFTRLHQGELGVGRAIIDQLEEEHG